MALLAPAPSAAQRTCDDYVGRVVQPQTFAAATAAFARIAPKGEFEPTADYDARRAAAIGKAGTPLVIAKAPEPGSLTYDADAQAWRIGAHAFGHSHFDFWRADLAAKGVELGASHDRNYGVVVARADAPAGRYAAVNGFGARFTVQRIRRRTAAIFDRPRDAQLPTEPPGVFEDLAPLPMHAAEARRLKPLLRLALVVEPKAPYYAGGMHLAQTPTFGAPERIEEHFAVLVGTLRCGLVLDDKNTVRAAYRTVH